MVSSEEDISDLYDATRDEDEFLDDLTLVFDAVPLVEVDGGMIGVPLAALQRRRIDRFGLLECVPSPICFFVSLVSIFPANGETSSNGINLIGCSFQSGVNQHKRLQIGLFARLIGVVNFGAQLGLAGDAFFKDHDESGHGKTFQ